MPARFDERGLQRSWLLLEDHVGLDNAHILQESYGLVAGNAHIASVLSQAGIAHRSGRELQSYDDAISATAATDADLAQIAPQLTALSEPLFAIAMAILAREGLRHHALRLVARELDGPFLQSGLAGFGPVTGRLQGTRAIVAPYRPAQSGPVKQARFRMDFSSATGRKNSAHRAPAYQPRLSTRPAWQDRVLNGMAAMALLARPSIGQALRIRLQDAPAPQIPQIDTASGFAACANALVAETVALFAAAEHSMDTILALYGRPTEATFNHVGDAVVAGFQASLRKADVPCGMFSHGALAAWGDGPRHRVAEQLGAIYNAFPGMTTLWPRACHLVPRKTDAQIITESRLCAPRIRRDGPFRIYAAPNFRPWSEGFWGLTNTCFDTLDLLSALAKAVRADPAMELFIRIKLTAKDVAQPHKRPANRGLFPEDVASLIHSHARIHDACSGSHSSFLAEADLVVTEGLTAVMFEALEARCPVLLLVPDQRAAPALPAAHVKHLAEPGYRTPVYTANPGDDLGLALNALRLAHQGRPLSDKEVSGIVWNSSV